MIKTIIFDWGGVLTVGKYTRSILKNISEERGIAIDEIYLGFDKVIVEMNAGKINFREFDEKIEEKLSLDIDEEKMRDFFRRSIVPSEDVIQLVKRLNSGYDLIMLSNNDEVTVGNLEKYHKDMLDLFSKRYFSYELNVRKPNLAIFEYALEDAGLVASECVFIDDKQKNVDAANEVGMKGILFESAEKLEKDLGELE